MATPAAQIRLTPEEYIAREREIFPRKMIRHEYINGELIKMSDASPAHDLITGNIYRELYTRLRGSEYDTYMNGSCLDRMRVSTPTTTSYFYPDVVVVCEELRFENDVFGTLLNPIILVEVFSPSTEVYDRREKFAHYRHLASLQEYVLVAQDKVLVEHYRRREKQEPAPATGNDWIFTDFQALEEILPLTFIQCELPLQEIYEYITFRD